MAMINEETVKTVMNNLTNEFDDIILSALEKEMGKIDYSSKQITPDKIKEKFRGNLRAKFWDLAGDYAILQQDTF